MAYDLRLGRIVHHLAVLRGCVRARRRAGKERRRQAAGRFRTDVEDPVRLLAGVAHGQRLEARQPVGARLAGRRQQRLQARERHSHPQRARDRLADLQAREVELRLVRSRSGRRSSCYAVPAEDGDRAVVEDSVSGNRVAACVGGVGAGGVGLVHVGRKARARPARAVGRADVGRHRRRE